MLRATKVGGAAGLAWPGLAGRLAWLAGWLACRLKFIDLIVKVIIGYKHRARAFQLVPVFTHGPRIEAWTPYLGVDPVFGCRPRI